MLEFESGLFYVLLLPCPSSKIKKNVMCMNSSQVTSTKHSNLETCKGMSIENFVIVVVSFIVAFAWCNGKRFGLFYVKTWIWACRPATLCENPNIRFVQKFQHSIITGPTLNTELIYGSFIYARKLNTFLILGDFSILIYHFLLSKH